MLANLLQPPAFDKKHWAGWDQFWFENWIDHQDIQEAVLKSLSINMDNYVITPWNPNDIEGALLRHQFLHNSMNAAIGAAGQDLGVLDFDDPESVRDWVYNHYQEHLAAHEALEI
jgi:hypothetical protein